MTAVALLSGGLDSTVAAALAWREHGLVLALTADYGQRSAAREVRAARGVAGALGVAHRVLDLGFLGQLTGTALVDRAAPLPAPDPAELDDLGGAALASMRAVWVPNRNGLLIAAAAAFAEAAAATRVVVGFNREEAATFPDNSREFLAAMNEALRYSTLNRVAVESPTVELDKAGIVARGYAAGAPMAHVWSCYEGGDRHCGACESCRRLYRALDATGNRERFEREWRGGDGHD